ncbi:hypothetical protein HD554DRAFT_2030008, partial [Boletus coccyginus]
RTSDVQYPPPSSHPSRASFDTLEDMNTDSMEATGKDCGTYRKRASACDGYRCMFTCTFDCNSVSRCTELEAMATLEPVVTVQTCHILNEPTIQGIDPTGTSKDSAVVNKIHYAAGAMAILGLIGFSTFTDAFERSGGVHQVRNLLSLEFNTHYKFDHRDLWVESTHQVCYFKALPIMLTRHHVDGAPVVVGFTSQFEEVLPPDPILLALHATCARVTHMSGVADFFLPARVGCERDQM